MNGSSPGISCIYPPSTSTAPGMTPLLPCLTLSSLLTRVQEGIEHKTVKKPAKKNLYELKILGNVPSDN